MTLSDIPYKTEKVEHIRDVVMDYLGEQGRVTNYDIKQVGKTLPSK